MRLSVDPSPKSSPDRKVLEVLAKEQRTLEKLTGLAIQVREALVRCDVATLEGLAGRQEILVQSLAELDASRQELMAKWLAQDGWELKRQEMQVEDEGVLLLAACEDVREQVGALQTANNVNHQLLAGIGRWMGRFLGTVVDLFAEAAPYDRHGVRPGHLESHLLVDRHG